MPFVTNQNVRIHYEVEGEGSPLVLVHGGFGSLEDWYDYGYVSQLKKNHKLILVDFRGHGQSDKPHEPDQYDLRMVAGDVIAVLDDLSIDNCHYLGFSAGGWIGFGLARYWSARLASLVILDHHPYPSDMTPVQEGAKTLALWVPGLDQISPAHKARWLKNDPKAIIAVATACHEIDASDVLGIINVPCLIVAARDAEDFAKVKRCSEETRNAGFVSLDGFDHLDVLVRGTEVLPYVVDFLSRVR